MLPTCHSALKLVVRFVHIWRNQLASNRTSMRYLVYGPWYAHRFSVMAVHFPMQFGGDEKRALEVIEGWEQKWLDEIEAFKSSLEHLDVYYLVGTHLPWYVITS